MSAICHSAAVHGIHARIVEVEVSVRRGRPQTVIVGLPDAAIREARDRVRTALEASGYDYPSESKVLVNLAPASRRKSGALYDLPIALGILAAAGLLPRERLARHVVLGELALDGRVRPVRGALPVAMRVARTDHAGLVLPRANAPEAGLCPGKTVYPVSTLADAAAWLAGGREIEPVRVDPAPLLATAADDGLDLSDVRGQEFAKRALVVAAAGAHNLLMVGPPGAGKTMLASRLPGILPPLTLSESLEATMVHSVAGLLRDAPLVAHRPFRAPHHSVSMAGLLGGGPSPRPGEVSLAHRGVLFLDELPEFDRRTLDALRQPIEEGRVRISRVRYAVRYPARFTLVAAMNPCRCGKHGTDDCVCTPPMVAAYQGRVSGPLLDRIDLVVEVPRLEWKDLAGRATGETSPAARERVIAARAVQAERLGEGRANATMTGRELRSTAPLDSRGRALLRDAVDRLGLTARGHDRVLRVARTIADLAGAKGVTARHLAEALQYRGVPTTGAR